MPPPVAMTALRMARRSSPRARATRSGDRPAAPYSEWISRTSQPASRSITRFELDERDVEVVGEHAAERRLAGAAQADQRDAAGARRVRRAARRTVRRALPRARCSDASSRPRSSCADRAPFGRRRRFLADQFGDRAVAARPRAAAAASRTHCPARFRDWRDGARRRRRRCASTLRVMPRRARSARTRSPSTVEERIPGRVQPAVRRHSRFMSVQLSHRVNALDCLTA